MDEFPNRLAELRRAAGWSQQELADRAGCSKMHVSGIERGKREFSLTWMRRFAEVFGVSTADLLSAEDNPYRPDDRGVQLLKRYAAADDATRDQLARVADAITRYDPEPQQDVDAA